MGRGQAPRERRGLASPTPARPRSCRTRRATSGTPPVPRKSTAASPGDAHYDHLIRTRNGFVSDDAEPLQTLKVQQVSACARMLPTVRGRAWGCDPDFVHCLGQHDSCLVSGAIVAGGPPDFSGDEQTSAATSPVTRSPTCHIVSRTVCSSIARAGSGPVHIAGAGRRNILVTKYRSIDTRSAHGNADRRHCEA